MHRHRKVLRTYDPQTNTVLLSKMGSRRLLAESDTPDHEFTREEIYIESLSKCWMIHERGSKIF